VKNGKDIIICNDAQQMISEICAIHADPEKLSHLAAAGMNTIQQHHAPGTITQKLIALIERKMKS